MSATTTAVARPKARERVRQTPPRRHLRVVDRAPRRHTGLFLVVYVLVAAGFVLGAVSLNALAAQDSIAIRELNRELVVDQRTYDRLVADVATLEDPARIALLAEQMGMIPADGVRLVVPATGLDSDGLPAATVGDDPVKSVIGQTP